jgi:hypothetical protein
MTRPPPFAWWIIPMGLLQGIGVSLCYRFYFAGPAVIDPSDLKPPPGYIDAPIGPVRPGATLDTDNVTAIATWRPVATEPRGLFVCRFLPSDGKRGVDEVVMRDFQKGFRGDSGPEMVVRSSEIRRIEGHNVGIIDFVDGKTYGRTALLWVGDEPLGLMAVGNQIEIDAVAFETALASLARTRTHHALPDDAAYATGVAMRQGMQFAILPAIALAIVVSTIRRKRWVRDTAITAGVTLTTPPEQ